MHAVLEWSKYFFEGENIKQICEENRFVKQKNAGATPSLLLNRTVVGNTNNLDPHVMTINSASYFKPYCLKIIYKIIQKNKEL